MNVILLGAPGSGKGTQAQHICRALGVPQVSTGDIIRSAIREQTALGLEFKSYADAGELVPDDLVNRLVTAAWPNATARRVSCSTGIPGRWRKPSGSTPRSPGTAAASTVSSRSTWTRPLILERITGRRTDPGDRPRLSPDVRPAARSRSCTGWCSAPTTPKRCCGAGCEEYSEKTAPIVPYYEARGLLRRVNGEGAVADVKRRVLDALGIEEAAIA